MWETLQLCKVATHPGDFPLDWISFFYAVHLFCHARHLLVRSAPLRPGLLRRQLLKSSPPARSTHIHTPTNAHTLPLDTPTNRPLLNIHKYAYRHNRRPKKELIISKSNQPPDKSQQESKKKYGGGFRSSMVTWLVKKLDETAGPCRRGSFPPLGE